MSDIFVSYAKEDRAKVKTLVDALEGKGWRVFWDRNIPVGKTWRAVLSEKLTETRCLVVVWSRRSVESHWVQEEAEFARQRGILVPVLIDDVCPPVGFQSLQAGDLSAWDGSGGDATFADVVEAVARLVDVAGTDADSLERSSQVRSGQYGDSDDLSFLKDVDPEEIKSAANAGHGEAIFMLGLMYSNGYVVQQDFRQARYWLQKSVDLGNPISMRYLGAQFYNGDGGTQDFQKARQLFEKAAAAGDAASMCFLGRMYEVGNGVGQDFKVARKWFQHAADGGNAEGMLRLGMLYLTGDAVIKDEQQAAQWFRQAADSGNADAMCLLGRLYERGTGVKLNYQSAVDWFEKAAAGGSAAAMTRLGGLYSTGTGVSRDFSKARYWLERAVDAGDTEAMFPLGLFYESGVAVEKPDHQRARSLFEKAAAAGESAAIEKLKQLRK